MSSGTRNIESQDLANPRSLGLWDTVSVIVGIVIGAGIYETPPMVLSTVSGPGAAMLLWAAGGVLSLAGALTYAELASTYPRSGGDYVYLTRAYGPCVGFFFGWAQLAVIMTGSIGMMAYVFATYATRLCNCGGAASVFYASTAVVALTLLNVLGVVFGKTVQNIMSAAKLLGLAGIVVAGFCFAAPRETVPAAGERDGAAAAVESAAVDAAPAGPTMSMASIALGLVFVLLTYGGWNDAAFFVAEMRDRSRIWLALVLGTGLVTVVYLLVNAAYLRALGFEGALHSKAIAADTLARAPRPLGPAAGNAMCVLVMISALGAVNGLIFAGSRVYASLGADYGLFRWLARRHLRLNSPVWSLTAQAAITLGMILLLGLTWGQEQLDALFQSLGLEGFSWQGQDGFNTLLRATAPIFWSFFLLTGLSIFVLRWRDPAAPRPFKTPLYPLTPILFCTACAYMIYSSANYAGKLGLLGAGMLAIGLPVYWISRPTRVHEG